MGENGMEPVAFSGECIYGETEMSFEKLTFVWKLKDAINTLENLGNLFSPAFKGNDDHEWQLRLNTRRAPTGNVTNLRLHLYLSKMSPTVDERTKQIGLRARFQLSFMDAACCLLRGPIGGDAPNVYHEKSGWGHESILTMEALKTTQANLVSGGNLIVMCTVQTEFQVKHRTCQLRDIRFPLPQQQPSPETSDQLPNNFLELLKNPMFSDLVVEVGTENPTLFQVHKVVLAARSPALLDMLTKPEAQPVEKLCIPSSFDPDVVKLMLEYMYGGKIEDRKDLIAAKPAQVLRIGSQYQLQDFLDMCDQIIAGAIDCGNALDILVAADGAGRSQLKEKVIFFINWNRSCIEMEPFRKMAASAPQVFKDLYMA